MNSVWEEGPVSLLAIQRLHTPRVPSAPPWVPHRQHGQRWGCSAQLTPHLLPVRIWALTRAEHTHECCPAGPALLHPRPPSPPCSQRGESRACEGLPSTTSPVQQPVLIPAKVFPSTRPLSSGTGKLWEGRRFEKMRVQQQLWDRKAKGKPPNAAGLPFSPPHPLLTHRAVQGQLFPQLQCGAKARRGRGGRGSGGSPALTRRS